MKESAVSSDALRFKFGDNWLDFLSVLNEDRIEAAVGSLKRIIGATNLSGRTFLDAGSGSGLFSLAARRLGATVFSFDYDAQSTECTRQIKEKYFHGDPGWTIERGSVLDDEFLGKLGTFDVVYSWGVLHHTGNMHLAFKNISELVSKNGILIISIYNDQGFISKYWKFIKRAYNKNPLNRFFLILMHSPDLLLLRFIVRTATGRLKEERGMTLWHDMTDWLGGYPFEVAKPEDVFAFFNERGFRLSKLKTYGSRHGCNEYVFIKEK